MMQVDDAKVGELLDYAQFVRNQLWALERSIDRAEKMERGGSKSAAFLAGELDFLMDIADALTRDLGHLFGVPGFENVNAAITMSLWPLGEPLMPIK